MHDFPVSYQTVDTNAIVDIHKYLIRKQDIL